MRPPPTLGGRQVWTDRRLRRGHRVQVHAWLPGLHRLLDRGDRMLALGGEAEVLGAFERLVPPPPAGRVGRPCVIALHGLGRSRGTFDPLTAVLAARLPGTELLRLGYASAWASPAAHGRLVAEALAATEPRARVALVAFSMGALVARHALDELAREAPDRLAAIDRLVMIAPPNNGAALAGALERLPLPVALPPSVRGLSATGAGGAPLPRVPAAVIAGDGGPRCGDWWAEPNDGLLRVADTRLPGLWSHVTVPALHFLMLRQPRVLDLAVDLLTQPVPLAGAPP
jgi:hypothetical protein